MKKTNELKAGVLLTYLNLGISFVIPLLYTPIMLRLLGQAEYGLYSLSQSVVSYLSLLNLGLGTSINRYLIKYKANNDKDMFERLSGLFIIVYTTIALVVCVVGCGLAFFSKDMFARGLSGKEIEKLQILIILMSFGVALSFVSSVFSCIITCHEKYIFRRIIDVLLTIATPIFNLVMLYAGYASIGMTIVSLSLQIIGFGMQIWYCTKRLNIYPRFKNPPKELLKGIFTFTAFVFVSMIADLLYWATDKVLIGAMIGTTAVAVYNIGSTFNAMLQNIASAISGVFGPRVNTYVVKGEPLSVISELMIRVGRLQYLLVALILSGYIAFGRSFIFIWAGQEYSQAYWIALLTMIPLAIPLIQNIAFTTICAQKRHQFRSVLYAVLAVANVIGTYLLIPIMGIIGAASCTCVVFLIGHGVIMNWFYYKKIGLDVPTFWKNIVKLTVIPSVLILITILLGQYVLNFNKPIVFVGGIMVYTAVYCVLSWRFSMNEYEKSLVLGMLRKFKIIK